MAELGWIEVEDGDVFAGTPEQFADAFFANPTEERIGEWAAENNYGVVYRYEDRGRVPPLQP